MVYIPIFGGAWGALSVGVYGGIIIVWISFYGIFGVFLSIKNVISTVIATMVGMDAYIGHAVIKIR